MEEVVAVIVGAGPSGLATSACLTNLSIPNLVLEREDCHASLWKKRTYDRLTIHLAKEFCSLPLMPHPLTCPTFMSKNDFVQYLDNYVSYFNINPLYCRSVISASYDEIESKWRIEAKNTLTGIVEVYSAKFLVVATGENGEGFIPKIPGLDGFKGEILHSSDYKTGAKYMDRKVLIVGCGNSGMEIAYDLSNFGACSSIVVRSPVTLSLSLIRRCLILFPFLNCAWISCMKDEYAVLC